MSYTDLNRQRLQNCAIEQHILLDVREPIHEALQAGYTVL